MLTHRQKQALDFIDEWTHENGGVSPSLAEMCTAIGWRNRSAAHRVVVALEQRGYIRRLPYRARAYEVIKRPVDHEFRYAGKPLVPRCRPIPMMGKIS